MIKFSEVEYQNFLASGNSPIKISLDECGLTLITGKNGSGKSQIIEAITFALFGKPYRNFNKPQLINSINQKRTLVTLKFSIGKKDYKIVRGIKPNKFEIYEGDTLVNQDPSSRDYQKYLEQNIIKMNYRAFTQVVVMGSSSYVPFMRLKANDRREFIEDLLDIRIFSVMNDILKVNQKTLRDEIKFLEVDIKSLREKIELQKSHVEKRKKEKKQSLNLIRENITKLVSENDSLQVEIDELQVKIRNLNQESEEYESSLELLSDLKSTRKRIEKNIKDQEKEREFYETVDKCPSCKQVIDEEHKCHVIDNATTKLNDLEKDIRELNIEMETVTHNSKKFERITSDINELNKKVNEINKSILVNNTIIEKDKDHLAELENNNTNIEEEERVLKEYAKDIVEKINTKKDQVEMREYQDACSVLLQDNGIKAKIIKQYIPLINKLINKYLDAMDFFVGFNLDENFNEVIKSRHRDKFSYESFSDGQKRRIDVALLLTWRDVARSKNSINTNLLFLDEADAALDGTGSDTLMELYRTSDIANIFVISHKENLSNVADRVISFGLKNNFTTILESDS